MHQQAVASAELEAFVFFNGRLTFAQRGAKRNSAIFRPFASGHGFPLFFVAFESVQRDGVGVELIGLGRYSDLMRGPLQYERCRLWVIQVRWLPVNERCGRTGDDFAGGRP